MSPSSMSAEGEETSKSSTLRRAQKVDDLEKGDATLTSSEHNNKNRASTLDRRTAAEHRIKAADAANDILRENEFSVKVVAKVSNLKKHVTMRSDFLQFLSTEFVCVPSARWDCHFCAYRRPRLWGPHLQPTTDATYHPPRFSRSIPSGRGIVGPGGGPRARYRGQVP